MDIKKIILYAAIALLGAIIWTTWQKDYPPADIQQKGASTSMETTKKADSFTPSAYQPGTSRADTSPTKKERNVSVTRNVGGAYTTVTTDILELKIAERGGNIIEAKLLKYPVSLKQKNTYFLLLNNNAQHLYIAQSGITNGVDSNKIRFKAQKQRYILQPGQQKITVRLSGRTASGLLLTKSYTLEKGMYGVKEKLQVKNQSAKTWKGSFFRQFTQKNDSKHSLFSRSYTGAAISSSEKPYKKLPYKELNEQNIDRNISSGWIALQEPYFVGAWVPQQNKENHYYSRSFGSGDSAKGKTFVVGYVSPQFTLASGKSVSSLSTLYVGPELAKQLSIVAHSLDLTIDYGWFWFLSKPIFLVMTTIHSFVGNWGWAIILATLLIKLILFPLSAKSFKSMAKMRAVAPQMKALKERHGSDKKALGKATMAFYKKEKVNPVGGCLPMLIQAPVFIALYYVLIESVQLRQAPFIFWIHDLSIKDPYYILPILMGITMFFQQKLSPSPPDPTQAKMMMFLPVIFTVFFLSFPAGLVLYWITNNCLTIAQQWYVMKTYDSKAEAKKQQKKKRR